MGDDMKVICVGHAAWDITIPVDEYPKENTKNRYNEVIECGGGPAATGAFLLGKWGVNPYYIGTVGNDIYGNKIIESLNNVDVNTEFVKKVDESTTCGIILANKTNGSRTILTYQNGEICSKELVSLSFEPDIMLFDGQEYIITKDILDKYPNVISVMDASRVNDINIELAKRATYVVCSKEFAEGLAGEKFDFNSSNSLINMYNTLKNKIPGVLVITLGKYGSIYEIDGVVMRMSAMDIDAIDTTGAGDIYHGAFIYGLVSGMNFNDVIKLATITAGLSTEYVGIQNSVVSLDKVKEKMYDVK